MPPFQGNASHHDDDFKLSSKPQISGFTSSLLNTIVVSKSNMDDWVDYQKAKIDQEEESYRLKLQEEQDSIDSLATNILGIQMERGLSVKSQEGSEETDQQQAENLSNKKNALEKQLTSLEYDLQKLRPEFKMREKRIQDITIEESKQRLRAQDARSLKQRIQEAKQTTVDDLTRGIVNYKYLGLDFEKTDVENELRFFFSHLDPTNPSRQFSFVLQVDDLDRYDVCDVEPSIDATVLLPISDTLNNTDDMAFLVRKMRRAFLDTL